MTNDRILGVLARLEAFAAAEKAKSYEPGLPRGGDFFHDGVAFGVGEAVRSIRAELGA